MKFVNFHDRSQVPHPVDVVWSRPNCGQLLVEKKLKALCAELVGPCKMGKMIKMEEFFQHFSTENIPCPSGRDSKAHLILLRITPHQITKRAIMRYLLEPIQSLHLLHRLNQRGQPSMHSKYLFIDASCNGKIIKNISKMLPYQCIPIFGLTLHIEAIVLGDCPCLMIASNHMHPTGIFNLKQTQESNNFHTMSSSINKITQE